MLPKVIFFLLVLTTLVQNSYESITGGIIGAGITIVLNLLLNNLKRLETVTLIPSQDFVLPDWLSDYDTIGSLILKNTQIRGLDSMTLIKCVAKEKTPVDASDTSNVMITMLLNLTLDQIELFTGYDIDVGILNMIPLYGIGDLKLALSAAKVSVNVDIKIANDFSKILISGLDIQLSIRDSPSYITGFWKNEDASNIFTGALNILEKFFCMWFDYERTSINSAISNILEFVMNKIILRSIETPDLSKYECIKKNKYNLLEHLENFALFHENGTTQEYFVSNTTRRDLQKFYSDTIQVIIDILEEGDFSKYML